MTEQELRANSALQELQNCNVMLIQRLIILSGENAVLLKKFTDLTESLKTIKE
jgi:hypothetical protein